MPLLSTALARFGHSALDKYIRNALKVHRPMGRATKVAGSSTPRRAATCALRARKSHPSEEELRWAQSGWESLQGLPFRCTEVYLYCTKYNYNNNVADGRSGFWIPVMQKITKPYLATRSAAQRGARWPARSSAPLMRPLALSTVSTFSDFSTDMPEHQVPPATALESSKAQEQYVLRTKHNQPYDRPALTFCHSGSCRCLVTTWYLACCI